MSQVIEAVHETGILWPEQPLPLTNRKRVRLVVYDHGRTKTLEIRVDGSEREHVFS